MIWRGIPNHSIYEISENGDVRKSLNAQAGHRWLKGPGELLKPSFHDKKDKYQIVRLTSNEGLSHVCKIHQLVTLTFHGPRPTPKHCALHKNDDKQNNHYTNLYWGTKKQNAIDRSINGKCGNSKLTPYDVSWIREIHQRDCWFYHELADYFGVDTATIAQVIKGKTFRWVQTYTWARVYPPC